MVEFGVEVISIDCKTPGAGAGGGGGGFGQAQRVKVKTTIARDLIPLGRYKTFVPIFSLPNPLLPILS